MKRLKRRLKRWNKWRKYSKDNAIHKLLVLLGIRKSLTFILTLTDEEEALYGNDSYLSLIASVNAISFATHKAKCVIDEVGEKIKDFQETIKKDGLS